MFSTCSDLRQMGHCQHLMLLPQRAQQPPHHFSHAPADACVDFIEDHRCDARFDRCQHLDREAHARQFAARSNFGKRPQRLPGVCGDLKFTSFEATGGGLARREFDGKFAARHRQLL